MALTQPEQQQIRNTRLKKPEVNRPPIIDLNDVQKPLISIKNETPTKDVLSHPVMVKDFENYVKESLSDGTLEKQHNVRKITLIVVKITKDRTMILGCSQHRFHFSDGIKLFSDFFITF